MDEKHQVLFVRGGESRDLYRTLYRNRIHNTGRKSVLKIIQGDEKLCAFFYANICVL